MRRDRRLLYGSSVDAYWHPLTPEHGFPSLLLSAPKRDISVRKALPSRTPEGYREPFFTSFQKNTTKNESRPTGQLSVKGFFKRSLRWHYPNQVRSKVTPSSQPVVQAPARLIVILQYTPLFKVLQVFLSKLLYYAGFCLSVNIVELFGNKHICIISLFFLPSAGRVCALRQI